MKKIIWQGIDSLKPLVVSIDSINFDTKNARIHGERSIESIKSSLRQFGQVKPIVVKNGICFAGNGTLQSARELGWNSIAIVDASNLSDDQIRAYALSDNRTAELSKWDMNILPFAMNSLIEMNFDIGELGWNNDEIMNITSMIEPDINDDSNIRKPKPKPEKELNSSNEQIDNEENDDIVVCPNCGHKIGES